jgi:histidinol-phosphate aminotransferase
LAAAEWLARLRARKILVRWWNQPDVRECLRISIGTEDEVEALLDAARGILRQLTAQTSRS